MLDPRPYLHVPFVENGRGWGGSDCWGIVRLVFERAFNISLPLIDTVDSSDHRAVGQAMPAEALNWREVLRGPLLHGEEKRLRDGDVLLLRRSGRPAHVGVVIGTPFFLHSEQGAGVVVQSITERAWPRLLVAAYRHPTLG